MNRFLSNKIIAGIVAVALLAGVGVLVSSGETSSTTRNASLFVAKPCTKPGQIIKLSKQSVVCAALSPKNIWYPVLQEKKWICAKLGITRTQNGVFSVCGKNKSSKKRWFFTKPLMANSDPGLPTTDPDAVSKLAANPELIVETSPATPLAPADTTVTTLAPAVPAVLSLLTQPSGGVNALALETQPVVQLLDQRGASISTAGITITAVSGRTDVVLSGNTAVTDATGRATFTTLSLKGIMGDITLTFTASGLEGITSDKFVLAPGAATQLVNSTAFGSVVSGKAFDQQPVLHLEDSSANVIAVSGVDVSVASSTQGLSGATTVATNKNGIAGFTDLALTQAGATILTFTSGELSTTIEFTVVAGDYTTVKITTEASEAATNAEALAIQPAVQLFDANNNTVTTAGITVTATITQFPDTDTDKAATLLNPTATTDAQGIATFTGLGIAGLIGSYTLGYTPTTGVTQASEKSTTLSAGVATQLIVVTPADSPVGNSEAGTWSLPQSPVIGLRDSSNNPVLTSGVTVTATVTGQDPTTAQTNAQGEATIGLIFSGDDAGDRKITYSALRLVMDPTTITLPLLTPVVQAWVLPTDQKTTSPAFTLAAPTSNSNGAWTYTSSKATIATVTSTSTVTVTPEGAPGTATITATQAATAKYASVSTTADLVIGLTPAVVSSTWVLPTDKTTTSDAFTPTAPASNSNGAWTYESSNATSATVTSTGQIAPQDDAGTVTITATQAATTKFASVSTTADLVIALTPAVVSSTWTLPTGKTTTSQAFTPTPPTSNSNGAWTYESSKPTTATVTTAGQIAPQDVAGTVTITATQAATTKFASVSTTADLVIALTPAVAENLIVPIGLTTTSPTFPLTDPESNSDGAWTYASDNTDVATVTGDVVTITGAGSTTITATQKATTKYTGTTQTDSLSVATVPSTNTITTAPAGAVNGVALVTQPVVQLVDVNGVAKQYANVVVTVSSSRTDVVLSGNTAVTNNQGIARFTNLTLVGIMGDVDLTFTPAGLVGARTSLKLTAGAPTRLVSSANLRNVVSGKVLSPSPVLHLQDASGNRIATSGTTVTVTAPNTFGLAGSTSATTNTDGDATFDGLSLKKSGTTALTFSAGEIETQDTVTVVASDHNAVEVIRPASTTAANDDALAIQPQVQLIDENGNNVTTGNVVVTVKIVTSNTATLPVITSATATTNASGIATFKNLTLTGLVGSYLLSYSPSKSLGIPGATTNEASPTELAPGTRTALRIVTAAAGPSANTSTGVWSLATEPVIALYDTSGNAVGQSGVVITAQTTQQDAKFTATTDDNGRATFTDMTFTGAASRRTITYSASRVTSNSQSIDLDIMASGALALTVPTGLITTSDPFRLTDPESNSNGAWTYASDNTDVATVTGDVVTITGAAGTAKITATQKATPTYSGTTTLTDLVIALTPAVVSSTWTLPTGKTTTSQAFTPTAPKSTNENGAWTYASSNAAIATVTIAGQIAPPFVAGTVRITATQAATTKFASVSTTADLVIGLTPTVVSPAWVLPTDKITTSQAFTPTAPTSTNTTGRWTYASSQPATATVTLAGQIAPQDVAGEVIITATQAATPMYAGVSTTATLVIGLTPTVVSPAWELPTGKTTTSPAFTPKAPTSNSNGGWTYESSDATIATVDATGLITPQDVAGEVTITATQAATPKFASVSTTTTLVIGLTPAVVSSTWKLPTGTTTTSPAFAPTAPTSNSNGAWTYESSDATIATVFSEVLVTPQDVAGEVTITATQAATTKFASVSTTATLVIGRAIPVLQAFAGPWELPTDTTTTSPNFAPTAPTSNSNGGWTYESSDATFATVTTTGLIAPQDVAGTVTITATQAATPKFASVSTTATLVIGLTPAVVSSTWTLPTGKTPTSREFALRAPRSNSNGGWTYESSDATIATVDATGLITPQDVAGEVTITATQAATTKFASVSTTATLVIGLTPTVVSKTWTLPTDQTTTSQAFTPTAPASNSNGAWTYESSDATIATVTTAGLIAPQDVAGEVTITATQAATPKFASVSTTADLVIGLTPTVVSPAWVLPTDKITTSQAFTPTAPKSTNETGAWTYASSQPATATVTLAGQIAPISVGTTIIKATHAATAKYGFVETTATLVIGLTPTVVSPAWVLPTGKTAMSQAFTPTAPTSNDSNGAWTYTSSQPATAIVTTAGQIAPISVGTTTIKATHAATAKYGFAETTATLAISSSCATAEPYPVGQTGPGGGIVFYAAYVGTLCYKLEVAPTDYKVGTTTSKAEWGCTGTSVMTATQRTASLAIGQGRANTQRINEALCKGQTGTASAASLAKAYNGGGMFDWFLPSKDELNQLCRYARGLSVDYTAISCLGTGTIVPGFSSDRYWSSSESDPNINAWLQKLFTEGTQYSHCKVCDEFVRPVREFRTYVPIDYKAGDTGPAGGGLTPTVVSPTWVLPTDKITTSQAFTLGKPTSNDSYGAWTYTSSNATIATVTPAGEVTVIGIAGTVRITATHAATTMYQSVSTTADLVIGLTPAVVSSPWGLPGDKTTTSDAFALTAPTSTNTTGGWTYTSSDATIATVDDRVFITPRDVAGTVKITATQEATRKFASVFTTFDLVIGLAIPVLQAYADPWQLPSQTTTSQAFPPTAPTSTNTTGGWTYASSNATIATVTTAGQIAPQNVAGTVRITATQAATTKFQSTSTTADLVIGLTPTVVSPAWVLPTDKIKTSPVFTLTPPTSNDSDGAWTYTSSPTTFATVTTTGQVTPKGVGTTSIKATHAATAKYGFVETTATLVIAPSCATAEPYAVGQTGPGGGIVFYAAFDGTKCYKLEAATANGTTPSTWIPAIRPQWCSSPTNVMDAAQRTASLEIGRGRANTNMLTEATCNLATSAASVAKAYNGGGKTDWSLPSKNELNELCKYARNTGQAVGAIIRCEKGSIRSGFAADYYWSSSERSANGAWNQDFNYGNQYNLNKYDSSYVRPVRAF